MEEHKLMDYYVLLTGGKNNAGDYLIKYRAKKLLSDLRPDRKYKDFNAWEPFDEEKLEIVNNSKGLLLTGGPALNKNMYPGIYKLTNNLDDIEVPIIPFGIGWHSESGEWEDIQTYKLNDSTKKLISKISENDFFSSVRDYHSLHVLEKYGMEKVLMTGCPALYELGSLDQEINIDKIKKVNFSLGVSFSKSAKMEKSVKQIILLLKDFFGEANVNVVFHHSIAKSYLETPDPRVRLYKKNIEFSKWLDEIGVQYKDISGTAEELIESYSNADLHVGYRVHAHIFMSSISKPSVLIAEDGRGKALRSLLGGVIFDGFISRKTTKLFKGLNKLKILPFDLFNTDQKLPNLLLSTVKYELNNQGPRLKITRNNINNHFDMMKKFVNQLP